MDADEPELELSDGQGGLRLNQGKFSRWIYAFFGVHMLAFGLSGFYMAYSDNGPGLDFVYMHGGIACLVYIVFYFTIFGVDEVKWMFINATLGLFGIYAQIDLILGAFGKRAADYPPSVHFVPFLYYVLYTFLLHQAFLDFSGARDKPERRRLVNAVYVIGSLLLYGMLWMKGR